MFKERLEKAFGSEEIEKARHGVYADNAENRAKQRVGQEYGQAAQPQEPGEKRQPKGGEEGGGDIKSYASNASDEALKRAAADKNAKPEVREAAKNELANRGNGGGQKAADSAQPKAKKVADFKSLEKEYGKLNGDFSSLSDKELSSYYKQYSKHIENGDYSDDYDTASAVLCEIQQREMGLAKKGEKVDYKKYGCDSREDYNTDVHELNYFGFEGHQPLGRTSSQNARQFVKRMQGNSGFRDLYETMKEKLGYNADNNKFVKTVEKELAKTEEKKDMDSPQSKDSEKKNVKPSQKEIDERQKKIDKLTYDINWYRNPRHRTELKGEEKDKVEAWEKELAELENDDRFIDKSVKIRGEYINHDFADSLTKRDLKKILKETGNGKDVYTVSSAYYDKDKKALRINGRGSGSSWIEKTIPLNTISSPTLTEKYKEYGDKVDEIVNKKNPGELDKHDLADAINTEVNTIFSDASNDISNDDPTFRDKVYDIYKKYSKDNPMDVWKYSQYVGHMDASQAVRLGYYINARNAGATPPEAERYMKDTYEDRINYTKEHNFDSSGFAPKAFKKGI